MAAPSERTVVQVAYDDRSIFIAVRSYDRDPSGIVESLGRRDTEPRSDRLFVSLDPRHDHLTAYVFEVNASGVQRDYTAFDDTRTSLDYSGVWEVATQVTDEGWMAEFEIPLSQMQFDVPPGEEVIWGFQVRRDIYRRGELDRWVGLPRGEQGFVSRFGHLVFGDRLSPPRRIEVLPFTFARREDAATTNPKYAANAGSDLRFGLGTSATLSGTINPDFGQVELDPAVLNLTVFETFFPERRPFFLENSGTFSLPYGEFQVFHSRRIGQRPGWLPLEPDDSLVVRPDQTTILAATKVTGKASRWTYGALSALTAREYATVTAVSVDSAGTESASRIDRLIEPRTSYNVARVQRDILGGTSNVGAIATAVVRDQAADAFTAGADYNLRWGENLWVWNGHWVVTRAPVAGEQRTGFGGVTNLRYFGKYVGFDTHLDHFTPDFQNTDVGFKNGRIDKTAVTGAFFLRQPDPWGIFRSTQLGVGGRRVWNTDGVDLQRSLNLYAFALFRSFWAINLAATRNLRALDDLDTRGGPPIVNPAETLLTVFVGSDSRKTWQVLVRLDGGRDEEAGWSVGFRPELQLQASARLQGSLSTSYRIARDPAQWISNEDVNGDGETDHVYGRLRSNVIDVTARVTYAFHRDLTLEGFVQPFVAVGKYTDIGRLARPNSFEFEPASVPSDPDFNRKSLRGNVVLRWEYLRGSTLFLVWSMATVDGARPGVFSPLRDLGSAFKADGTHVFMVKMNYWLGLQ